MTITIFLADDHPLLLDGLELVLSREPDLKVIGRAANGRELVNLVAKRQPDVVITDITMPELNGIEATRQIRELYPRVRVIVLSIHDTMHHVMWSLEAGADGYLLKGSAGQEVVQAVRVVYRGQRYLSHRVAAMMGENELTPRQAPIVMNPLQRLSQREREVLQLVAEGHTNAKIAVELNLSPKSIATYRRRVMDKLDLDDTTDLIKFALQNKITPSH